MCVVVRDRSPARRTAAVLFVLTDVPLVRLVLGSRFERDVLAGLAADHGAVLDSPGDGLRQDLVQGPSGHLLRARIRRRDDLPLLILVPVHGSPLSLDQT